MNGGYDESSRSFALYFDGLHLGSIGCYVNYCQARFVIPSGVTPGPHVVSVEGGSQIVVEVVTAAARVVVLDVDLVGEVVTLANQGSASLDMTGWTLVSDVGSQVFQFPDGFVLAPDATVLVTSGPDGYSEPPAVLQWLRADGSPSRGYVWNNDGDPAHLRDGQGEVVSTFP